MDLGIAGRSALVLGAGGGLGRAIAQCLADEGARVAVADLVPEAVEATASGIAERGGDVVAVSWDLADHSAAEQAVKRLADEGRPVDILVNITGGPPPGTAMSQNIEDWRRFFDSMVLSVIHLTDLVLPGMVERGWGRIVTSTSSGVVTPIPNLGLSNSLRSALVGWSKTLAREVGRSGVTSNIVIPGRIATPRITFLDDAKAEREDRDIDEVRRESWSAIALGRYGRPEEYAAAVAFLASEKAGYITGTAVRVDGGLIASI